MVDWTKPIQTIPPKCRKSRVLCVDRKVDIEDGDDRCVVVLIDYGYYEHLMSCELDGSDGNGNVAIINVPEKRTLEGYVSIHKDGSPGCIFWQSENDAKETSGVYVKVTGEYEV